MSAQYRWNPHVEVAELEGEWVVMNVEGLTMTRLNELGGFILAQFEQSCALEPVVNQVVDVYAVDRDQATRDVNRFVQSLRDAGLLDDVHE